METKTPELALGPFAEKGFTLENDGDHVLFLLHDGHPIARFSQTGATQDSIQGEAARHLVLEHKWDACLYEIAKKT